MAAEGRVYKPRVAHSGADECKCGRCSDPGFKDLGLWG